MATDWNMPRQADVCRTCARKFEPGEFFHVALYAAPEGYERIDRCRTCGPPADPPPIAAWQARQPQPTARATPAFDRAAVFEFFCRFDAGDDPDRLAFRFVLALLLWRKKALKFDQPVDGAAPETWRFSVPRSEQVFDVLRPDLDDEQTERLSAVLEQLLASGGLNAESAALPAATIGSPTSAAQP